MKNILLLLALSLSTVALPFTTRAETLTPDIVRDTYNLVAQTACRDHESDELGYCYVFHNGETFVMVFTQDGVPVFMRRVLSQGGYETIWTSSIPLGELL